MARGRFLGLTASPALPLAEGKGAGAVRRRRPLGLQANPPLFFPHPPTPPPQHTPGRVSLTHWLRCPSSPRLDRITSGGESPTSLGRAGWRWGRALLGETAGTVSGRGYGLGKGPLLGPPESPFSARSPAAAVSAADAADSPTPTSRKPLRVSADPSPA